jgi:pimeloyl-ACP methyl ester carboxylesterase
VSGRPAGLALGALGLGLLGYGAAVGAARRRAPTATSETAVEELINERVGRRGAVPHHHYLGTAQGRIHILEAGRGPAAVILVPGLGGSSGCYAALVGELGREFRVLAIDLPGTGLSDPIKFTGHPRSAWVQLIGELSEQLGLDHPHLVGHSMGGLAAGAYAVAAPERIGKLALLAPVGLAADPPRSWLAARIPGLPQLVFSLDGLVMDWQWAHGAGDISGLPGGPVEVGPDPEGYRRLVSRRFDRGFDLQAFARLLTWTGFHSDTRLLPGLGLLSQRSLVIFGEDDRKVASGPAADQLAHYPGIALEMVPGWGHLFPFLEPERTAKMLSSWLEPAPRASGSPGPPWAAGGEISPQPTQAQEGR